MKKIVVWMCMLILLIATVSCSKSKTVDNNNEEKKESSIEDSVYASITHGVYTEHEIKEPEMGKSEITLAIIQNTEKKIEYYTYDYNDSTKKWSIYCYTLQEGENYVKNDVIWANDALVEFDGYPRNLLLGQDGYYYFLIENSKSGLDEATESEVSTFQVELVQAKKDLSTYTCVTPSIWREVYSVIKGIQGIVIEDLQVTENSTLVYRKNYEKELSLYSLHDEQEVLSDIWTTEHSYKVLGNTIYYISDSATAIAYLNLITEEEDHIEIDNAGSNLCIQVALDGTIYLLDNLGIHRYQSGGTLWETVVDGSTCSMGSPNLKANTFILTDDYQTFYVNYKSLISDTEGLLTSYVIDSNQIDTTESQKVLNIYSLRESTTLRDAIKRYKSRHNDVEINYQVALKNNEGVNLSDLIRTFNTEVLAGNGADIFLMDGLPVESYVNKGVLMDLSDMLSEKITDGTFVTNIADDYVINDKIYCIPLRYCIPMYVERVNLKDTLSTVEKMVEYVSQGNQVLFEPQYYKDFMSQCLNLYYDEIITENGSIDEKAFTEFLTNIKIIASNASVHIYDELSWQFTPNEACNNNARIKRMFNGNYCFMLTNEVMASATYAKDMKDISIIKACADELNGCYDSINRLYIPNGIVAINQATKESELAKDFVMYLLSESVQSSHLDDGFPINIASLETWKNEPKSELYTGVGFISNGKQVTLMYEDLSVEEKQEVLRMIMSLEKPINNNTVLLDMIVEESADYLMDKKSLEDVVYDVITKVKRYLSEEVIKSRSIGMR